MTANRFTLASALVLGALYLLFLNPVLDIKAFNAHDPATYLLGAQSIWRGDGYGMHFADAYLPMKLQPPGLSFLLAPVVGFFGTNFVIIKLVMVALAGAMAWAALVLFARFLPSSEAAPSAVLLLMASPVVFRLAHQVLAEIPLLLCVLVALVSLDRYLRSATSLWSRTLVVASIATAAATFFKGLGLAVLLGGWLLMLFPRWRTAQTLKKLLVYTVLVAVPVLLWQWRCAMTPSVGFHGRSIVEFYLMQNPYQEGSPTVTAGDLLARVRYVIRWGMATNIALIFFAPLYFLTTSKAACLLGLAVMAALAWSWLQSCRREVSVLEGFTLTALGGLLLYVHGNAARYLSMLYPAFIVYGIRLLAAHARPALSRILPGLIAVSIGTTLVVAIDQWRNPFGHQLVHDYVAVAQEARRRFPAGSLGLAPMAAHWQLLTDHQDFRTAVGQEQAVREGRATYAVVLADLAAWRPEDFEYFKQDVIKGARSIHNAVLSAHETPSTVYENGTFKLLRLN